MWDKEEGWRGREEEVRPQRHTSEAVPAKYSFQVKVIWQILLTLEYRLKTIHTCVKITVYKLPLVIPYIHTGCTTCLPHTEY